MNTSDIINLLAAAGTIGATVVALFLGVRKGPRKIDGVFVWEAATKYQATLLIQNTSNRIAVIESVEIRYRGKQVYFIDLPGNLLFSRYVIIEIGQMQRILMPINENSFHMARPKDEEKRYRLKTIIRQHGGRRCCFTMKISYSELRTRFFIKGVLQGIGDTATG